MKINVLSLFDGMSCGQQALERTGIKVDNYFASEIDKYAIQVTMANYPNTIQLGSVVGVDGYSLPKIDLLIGGSPCQSFSFAGKRKGMSTKCETEILTLEHYLELKAEGYEFEGQSYLFWEYMRLLNEVKPKYFLLENVEMGEKWEKVLSKAIGVNGIHINSALVSAQNRKRIYWTNIGLEPAGLFGYPMSIIRKPKDKGILLKDILESEVDEKYFLSEKMFDWLTKHSEKKGNEFKKTKGDRKAGCLSISALKNVNLSADFIITNLNDEDKNYNLLKEQLEIKIKQVKQINPSLESGGNQPYQQNRIYDTNGISPALCANKSDLIINTSRIRRLTPTECERLQTVKDGYTAHVSDSQRYKMLGNGWTVDVIAYIFSYLE
jgi:DNA (cytosine-5)-methyltransferase 3A